MKKPRGFDSLTVQWSRAQFPIAPFVAILNDSLSTNITLGGLHVFAKRNGHSSVSNKGQPRKTVNGVSNKFKRMAELYKYFARHWAHVLDFSDDALLEMFNSESYGTYVNPKNGYLVGKQWLNVTVACWKEDIQMGTLYVKELYQDGNFPEWWLDGIFREYQGFKDK